MATITGNDNANNLTGGSGQDEIQGNGGNDTINPGRGAGDYVDGGAGDDLLVLDYSGITFAGNDQFTAGMTFDGTGTGSGLVSAYRDASGNQDTVEYFNMERFQVTGTPGTDRFWNFDFSGVESGGNFDNSGRLVTFGTVTLRDFESFQGIRFGSGSENVQLSGIFDDDVDLGGGDDTIDPGRGQDTVWGGTGDDLLMLDYSTNFFAGSSQYTAGMTFSAVLGTASAYRDANGNEDRVRFYGTERFAVAGTPKADTFYAGAGDDTLAGAGGNDAIQGMNGDDALSGGTGDDHLDGGGGADILDGGIGADTMAGGVGNDLYVVDNAWDVVEEWNAATEETDTVISVVSYTLGSNLENLFLDESGTSSGTGNDLANELAGGNGPNLLVGLAGDDTIDGRGGADTMEGGQGNDIYTVDSSTDVIIEISGAGEDWVLSPVNRTLPANVENIALTGTATINATGNSLPNRLVGNAAANRLVGNAGNDTLDGGSGGDTLDGGAGNDMYFVDHGLDSIVESSASTGGNDTVSSIVSHTLAANVENLALIGGSATNGTGNTLPNRLTGNNAPNKLSGLEGNDTLDGGSGADTLDGGAGNDSYLVDNAGDRVIETGSSLTEVDSVGSLISHTLGAYLENLTLLGNAATSGTGNSAPNSLAGNDANNTLSGGSGNDTLIGAGGNDYLTGGTGRDSMIGGAGNDIYVIDALDDTVIEQATADVDAIHSFVSIMLPSNVENLTLAGTSSIDGTGNSAANRITGNAVANRLAGGGGNDTLTGAAGADTMEGGAGNDWYFADSATDSVVETNPSSSEVDTAAASITFVLGANIENLVLVGDTAINGFGNALPNSMSGNAGPNRLAGGIGNDTLNGGAGADTMEGGTGDDWYVVDNSLDRVTEAGAAGSGVDTVSSYINHVLGTGVENLTLAGAAPLNGTGNQGANTLTGNAAANRLSGASGNDVLKGAAGKDTLDGGDDNDHLLGEADNDSLLGGTGNDTLDGGTGVDTLDGGSGNDTYMVDTPSDVIRESDPSATQVDTAQSGSHYVLPANVENLVLTGLSGINGAGNALGNSITGNPAANRLNGGTGRDTLTGGLGDDTYVVNQSDDMIRESIGAGADKVESYAPAFTLPSNVEGMALMGTANSSGTGNELANGLDGNSGANTLNGMAGADTINGAAGDDMLPGGTGNDSLSGGTGVDMVWGEAGNDTVAGDDANDYLNGGTEHDLLLGGQGNDFLDGGPGNDTLTGAKGYMDGDDDTLTGDTGADLFVLGDSKIDNYSHLGFATITDFQPGSDRLQLLKAFEKNGEFYTYTVLDSSQTAESLGISISDGAYGLFRRRGGNELPDFIATLQSADGSELTLANVIDTAVYA